jgi:hypothetical protein
LDKNKESAHKDATIESSTVKDLALPFRILIFPVKTFKQLATNPTRKGLLSLVVLIIVMSAVTVYTSATKIVLTVDPISVQHVDFIATSSFSSWFIGALSATVFSIALYWLTAAAALSLIGRFSFKGSKAISLRTSLVIFGYLLSVFVVLYAVRAVMYATLPPIPFPSSIWPPTVQAEKDEADRLITQNWTPLPAAQLIYYSTWVALVWLALLGTIAVKTMQEISWFKAALVSATGFLLTLTLFGLPP